MPTPLSWLVILSAWLPGSWAQMPDGMPDLSGIPGLQMGGGGMGGSTAGDMRASMAGKIPNQKKVIKKNRKQMCYAVIDEMAVEIKKHDLKKKGEDDIYETSTAICLGVVQNYTFREREDTGWTLIKKEKKTDMYGDEDLDPEDIPALLVVKEACAQFTDDWQQEISEVMWSKVYSEEPRKIAEEFCEDKFKLSKEQLEKQERLERKKREKKEAKKEDPEKAKREKTRKMMKDAGITEPESPKVPSFNELLEKYDTDGSITNLMEMEKNNPEMMLEDKDKKDLKVGQKQIMCDVCGVMVQEAHKLKVKQKARDETDISNIVADLCIGEKVEEGQYPKLPGNPPTWALGYTVGKTNKDKWRLKSLTKKQEKALQKGGDYNKNVKKNAMITRSCRAVLDKQDDVDLAELMILHADWSVQDLSRHFCTAVCGREPGPIRAAVADKDEL